MSWTEKYDKAFPEMAKLIKPQETENFKITHTVVTENDVKLAKLRSAIHANRDNDGLKPGTYVVLSRKSSMYNSTIMSDTWYEKFTNYELVDKARGDVLIAGLGIGMVVLALQDKDEVTTITIIEKEHEIINMIKSSIPFNKKINIIHTDIFKFNPHTKYDTIYFDIWDNVCGDNWQDIVHLQHLFQGKRNKNSFCSSWQKERVRHLNRSEY